MNILVIGHTYIAKINQEKWTTFARLYQQVNLKVVVPKSWNGNFHNHIFEQSETKVVNCEFIPLKTFFSGELKYCYHPKELKKIIEDFCPDLVHVEQGDNSLAYFEAIFLARSLLKNNVVFCFFSWVNWQHRFSWKYKILWKFFEKFNLKNSTGAIVGNLGAKHILESKKFSKPILVLPQLGIDLKYFYPKPKQDLSKKYIGFIGRFIEEKGIFLLLEAFAKLSSIYKDWNLIFLGGGAKELSLKSEIEKLNLQDRVDIISSVPHHRVRDYLWSFDIFVLPSFDTKEWKEQFGHVLIEAMASSIPVIGSNAGAIPEVIGNSGLIFEQKNADDLVGCLKFLINDEKARKDFAERGLKRVKANFSHEAIAQATFDFWTKLLSDFVANP